LGLYVALILLSFEMLYLERKWWLFPISIALLAALNVVNLYTCSVFLFLYVVFRVFGDEAGNFKQFSKLLVSMALLGALGILISSVLSLPNLMQMLDSPRVSGEASYVNSLASLPMFELGSGSYLLTLLMRTFSSDLLGNGSAYTGWRNYLEAPMSYCGLVTLLLIPQLFTFLRARQRLVYGTILGIFIFAAIFPWFRRGFWLFQGDYFRDYSLYTAVIFILFSVFALDRIIKGGKVHLMVLIGSLIVLLTLLYFPYSQQHERNDDGLQFSIDSVIQSKVTLFLILLTLILVLFSVKRLRQTMPVFLIVMVILELTILADHTVNQRDTLTTEELHKKIGYNDYSNEAITFIKQRDKDFFRLEKNYWSSPIKYSSFNDAKVQHYFGSSSYHSFNQINYIKFLSTADVLNAKIEEQTRWSPGVKRQPLLQLLTGVRYLLFKGNWKTSLGINYFSEIAKFGDVAVLQFQYALPMGVSYDTYITQSEFNQLDSNRKRIALLKGVMVSDAFTPQIPATMNALSRNDVAPNGYSLDELTLDTDKLKANPLHITSFSNNHIEGEITVASQQLLFFSIPFDVGWSAQINNQNVEMVMVDGGLSAVFVEPGKNVVELYYFPPFVKMGLLLTVLGVLIFLGLLRRKQLLD
ncbi:MAG: YfhO family protein, partial [Gallionella sp.]